MHSSAKSSTDCIRECACYTQTGLLASPRPIISTMEQNWTLIDVPFQTMTNVLDKVTEDASTVLAKACRQSMEIRLSEPGILHKIG